MARKFGESVENSDVQQLFDTQGQFNGQIDPFSGLNTSLLEAHKIINDMVAEATKGYTQLDVAVTAIIDLAEEERKEAAAWFEKEVEHKKTIFKIQKQIVDLIQQGDAEHAAALQEQLDKSEAIRDARAPKVAEKKEQTNKVKTDTALLQNAYGDTLDAAKEHEDAVKQQQELRNNLIKEGLKSGDLGMIKDGLTGGKDGKEGMVNALDKMTHALAGLVKQLDGTVQEIASYKSDWDTRLFGSDSTHHSITEVLKYTLGASPFVKQTDLLKNVDKAVEAGISYNIEQRAFLQTIKDDIAGTFDAFDSTLLQIIRVQQADSTAARLGMEAKLNEYLNKNYQTTEYLNSVSDSVTGALYEATSLLTSKESIGFEFQAQKWLGSLYSVGMSNQGVTDIASALGQLAAGDVSGTGSGAGKLLVMAASRAGLDYSAMLTDGLDDSEMNELMKSMVEYLKTIASSNKVVQSQLAQVYGLRTSDIEALRNLSTTDISNISNEYLDSSSAVLNLTRMAATIGTRMSTGEMMTNVIDNFKTNIASGIANDPALYALWTASNMLEEMTGGIPIPSIGAWAVGNGTQIDLETTVADLMRVGAMAGPLLGGIGAMVSGLASNAVGLSGAIGAFSLMSQDHLREKTARGSGLEMYTRDSGKRKLATTPFDTGSGMISMISNGSSGDVQESILSEAEDQKTELANNAKQEPEEQEKDIKLMDVNDTLEKLLEVFTDIAEGRKKLTTKTEIEYSGAGLPSGY